MNVGLAWSGPARRPGSRSGTSARSTAVRSPRPSTRRRGPARGRRRGAAAGSTLDVRAAGRGSGGSARRAPACAGAGPCARSPRTTAGAPARRWSSAASERLARRRAQPRQRLLGPIRCTRRAGTHTGLAASAPSAEPDSSPRAAVAASAAAGPAARSGGRPTPSTSSPPSPSITDPPGTASTSGTSPAIVGGHTTPCSSRCSAASGPTTSSSSWIDDPVPVAAAEVADDGFLPRPLVGVGDVRETPRDRHRLGQAVTPGHVGGDGQHQRRVASAGERHAARRALQRRRGRPARAPAAVSAVGSVDGGNVPDVAEERSRRRSPSGSSGTASRRRPPPLAYGARTSAAVGCAGRELSTSGR